jgi:O-antigen ligase
MISRMAFMTRRLLWQHPEARANLVRILVVSALLLIEIFVGILVSSDMALLAFALTTLPMIYFLLLYHRFGIIIILAAALFIRFQISTGTESDIVISLMFTSLFVGIWLLQQVLFEKKISFQPTPANKPLLLFLVTTALSLVWSNLLRDPLVSTWGSFPLVQAASTLVIFMLAGAYLLTANVVDDLRIIKGLVVLLLGASILGYLEFDFVQTRGTFTMWVVALAYAQALFNKDLPWWLRLACLGLTALWIEWSLLRRLTWLASWVPTLIVLGWLTMLRSRKLLLLLMVVMSVFLFTQKHGIEAAIAAEQDESGHSRLEAWQVNWRVTGKHLLFGTGPAGYAVYYMSYWPNEGMATHSNYIDILSETGVVGLFFYLWFFAAVLWSSYRIFRRLQSRNDFSSAYAAAVFAGAIGAIILMGLGDWIIPFAYTQGIEGFDYAVYTWIFLGGLYAVERLVPASDSEVDSKGNSHGSFSTDN